MHGVCPLLVTADVCVPLVQLQETEVGVQLDSLAC